MAEFIYFLIKGSTSIFEILESIESRSGGGGLGLGRGLTSGKAKWPFLPLIFWSSQLAFLKGISCSTDAITELRIKHYRGQGETLWQRWLYCFDIQGLVAPLKVTAALNETAVYVCLWKYMQKYINGSKYNNMQCLHKINHKTEIYTFFYLVKICFWFF